MGVFSPTAFARTPSSHGLTELVTKGAEAVPATGAPAYANEPAVTSEQAVVRERERA
jgi:hypothetical protein